MHVCAYVRMREKDGCSYLCECMYAMHVCMLHVCIYRRTCEYMYVCMHVCMCAWLCDYVCAWTFLNRFDRRAFRTFDGRMGNMLKCLKGTS